MIQPFKLSSTFVHLRDGGDAEQIKLTPAFWRGSPAGKEKHDRVLGVFEFKSDADLHSSMQEMHPEADEVIYLVAGAIELVLDEPDGERTVTIETGEASIVPRGVWHRLVMRRPGKLLFVNSRTGMRGRRHRPRSRSKNHHA